MSYYFPQSTLPEIRIIDKHPVRNFSAMACDGGVVLCAEDRGAFITLRYKEDLDKLKLLLDKIVITNSFDDEK